MIELNNRKIDDYGNIIYKEEGIIDRIMSGLSVDNLVMDNEKEVHNNNQYQELYDESIEILSTYSSPQLSIEDFDKNNQSDMFIPKEYININLYSYLKNKCKNQEEIKRIDYEYKLIVSRNMVSFFKCMIFLVDNFRKHDIIWGVGRGSSVSSFSLYLIGIHKINSILYDLDPHEFFK